MTVLSKFADVAQFEPFNNYYFYKACWKNALYNLMTSPEHLPTPTSRQKTLVAGSFETVDGWGIWGTAGKKDPQAFFDDWCQCHVWIEDEDGRIWDHLSEQYNDHIDKLAAALTKRGKDAKTKAVRIPPGGIDINGMTNAEIEATYGYSFVAAPLECQGHIFANTHKKWLPIKPYNFWTGTQYVEGYIGMGYKAATIPQQIDKNNIFYSLNKLPEAIFGDKKAQLWWRDFWQKPIDRSRFDYYIAEMGETTLTHNKPARLIEEAFEWIETGVLAKSLGGWMSEVIDEKTNRTPLEDISDAMASIAEGIFKSGIPTKGQSFSFGNFRADVISSTI